jgi:hypothetical protein
MSTRERWIVYPLLFLALGAALRDKMLNKIEVSRLQCDWLQVNGLATCEGQSVCRELIVAGPTGRPAVVAGTNPQLGNGGIIRTFTSNGLPLVQVAPSEVGGVVDVFGGGGEIRVGHVGKEFGIWAQVPGKGVVPLTRNWPIRTESASIDKKNGSHSGPKGGASPGKLAPPVQSPRQPKDNVKQEVGTPKKRG